VVVCEGARGRCGEASFLFYALSSGPAGPAMLARWLRGATQRDEVLPLLISAKQHPTTTVHLSADSRPRSIRLYSCCTAVSIDASLIDQLTMAYLRITSI